MNGKKAKRLIKLATKVSLDNFGKDSLTKQVLELGNNKIFLHKPDTRYAIYKGFKELYKINPERFNEII